MESRAPDTETISSPPHSRVCDNTGVRSTLVARPCNRRVVSVALPAKMDDDIGSMTQGQDLVSVLTEVWNLLRTGQLQTDCNIVMFVKQQSVQKLLAELKQHPQNLNLTSHCQHS